MQQLDSNGIIPSSTRHTLTLRDSRSNKSINNLFIAAKKQTRWVSPIDLSITTITIRSRHMYNQRPIPASVAHLTDGLETFR